MLPVVVGLVTGERPALLTWIGIGCALPAIWLVSTAADPVDVSGRPHGMAEGVTDGLLAGLGFGLLFSTLGQVPDTAGLGPLAMAQASSVFLLGTQTGLLTVASVLTSLYPAFTVLLAATLLRERIHAAQGAGLVLAAAAVVLVAAG